MAEVPVPVPRPIPASELIRDARTRAGLTQVQLAARAGVTQSVISTYENGRREPSLTALQRLVRAAGFETTIDLLPSCAPPPLHDRVAAARDDLIAAVRRNGGTRPRLVPAERRPHERSRQRDAVGLLVDLEPGAGIFTLMRIQDEAERLLDAEVEVLDGAGTDPERCRKAVPL